MTIAILATGGISRAQVQEQKLIDRLLKPDTTLQNNAQGKKFVPGGAITRRKAATKSFYFINRPAEKKYTNLPKIDAPLVPTRDAQLAHLEASTASHRQLPKLDTAYPTSSLATGLAPGTTKVIETSNYSDTRPFLIRGKSQQTLSAQDRPMTIDEVRELLNKNK